MNIPWVPVASAPIMFGIQTSPTALLPWRWAADRLLGARNYWIATTRPDRKPHCRPVWGIWLDNAFWFSTGSLARHNLMSSDAISVHLEDGDAPVIVEGRAERVTDSAALQRMCDIYSTKYDWPIRPDGEGVRDDHGAAGPAFRVLPEMVFGWDDDLDTATRWRFMPRGE